MARTERILKKFEFQKVFKEGKRIPHELFTLHVCFNKSGRKRIGIVTTKKLGNAVTRNRAKRILREIFRRNKTYMQGGDIVVIVHPSFKYKSYKEIKRAFLSFLLHHNILNNHTL